MSTPTFDSLNLLAPIRRALAAEEYSTPTPIQAAAMPPALAGRDVLGCAQTGTGKTAAFALPILQRLGAADRPAVPNEPAVLVIAPTRELAAQIGESFATYGRHLRVRHAVIFGGVGQGRQVDALNRGVHVLIATPGRLLDLKNQGHVRLGRVEVFVADEADRMFDMGFLPDLKRIVAALPAKRQTLFFSATMAPPVAELANRVLVDPVRVDIAPQGTTVERIEQGVIFVEKTLKRSLLVKVFEEHRIVRAIVFTRTKRGADIVAKHLDKHGIKAAAIHGNKSQNNRLRTLAEFKGEKLQVLVATDLAARGIDVDGITHVVNYELPNEPESYVHRIGRTARAGARGVAISFCCGEERGDLKAIERLIGKPVPVLGHHKLAEGEAAPSAAELADDKWAFERRPQGGGRGRGQAPRRPAASGGPRPGVRGGAPKPRPAGPKPHAGQPQPTAAKPATHGNRPATADAAHAGGVPRPHGTGRRRRRGPGNRTPMTAGGHAG